MKSTKIPSAKGVIKAGISSLITQVEKILLPLSVTHPGIWTAFQLSTGLYGYYMALNQEALNEYVEFLISHPHEFRKEIVVSKEFQRGFVVNLQDFLKSRTQRRKTIIKNIFLGFAEDDDKSDFPLERLDEVALKISVEAARTLVLMDKVILPLKDKTIREELKKKNIGTEKPVAWWYEQDFERESLSTYTQKWLYDKYNPNSDEVKRKYGVTDKWDKEKQNEVWDIEREEARKINITSDELVDLGILKIRLSPATYDGGNAILHDLTKLGFQFIKYIKGI